jgi:hypothetical protein
VNKREEYTIVFDEPVRAVTINGELSHLIQAAIDSDKGLFSIIEPAETPEDAV